MEALQLEKSTGAAEPPQPGTHLQFWVWSQAHSVHRLLAAPRTQNTVETT